MSWLGIPEKPKEPVPKPAIPSKEKIFKPLGEIAARRKLKIGVWGDKETGKSHVCCSCPPPVYIIDTEMGIAPLRHKFRDKEIYVLETFVEDPVTFKADPIKSLEMAEEAINSLRDVSEGTIAIDSGTDLWQWISDYMKQEWENRYKGTAREFQQWDWAIANNKYKELMMKLLSRDAVFVITAQPQEVYDVHGRRTGFFQPQWQKKTPFWVDVIVHMKKVIGEQALPKPVRYVGIIEKCRAERQFNLQIEDLDYDKLYEAIKKYL